MKNAEDIIPMDYAINEFDRHLSSHPRTILSARFGDGKSYFLAEAAAKLRNKYSFLTVYPVNYQIADNKDIFEYIKRDLLFQLYAKGFVNDQYEIPDDIATLFFIQNNWETLAEEMLKCLSEFDATNTLKATLGAAKFLKSIKKKYDEFKENGGEVGARIDCFLEKFDKEGVYEEDAITSAICDIIKNWKAKHKRHKVCLVFEDMDRIDPAHIFRILNIISAHMDYGYKYGVSPKSSSLAGNKFGVDNIVVCLDYDNLKGIFQHFYGQRACFEGYINKFSDRGIFRYSLHEQVMQYYVNVLVRITNMDSKAVMAILNYIDITAYTLRQLYHAMVDVEKQVSLPDGKGDILAHKGMYVMAALLRRLGHTTEEIRDIIAKAFQANPVEIGSYMATSMMLRQGMDMQLEFGYSFGKDRDNHLPVYEVTGCQDDGRANITRHLMVGWAVEDSKKNPYEEAEYILAHVSK